MREVARFLATAAKQVYARGEQPISVVESAEHQLGLAFPTQLREFLSQYGALSYGSVETLGVGVPETSYRNLVSRTHELRRHGLAPEYIAVEDQGEGFYILTASDGRIYEWNLEAPKHPPSAIAADLDGYLSRRLQTA